MYSDSDLEGAAAAGVLAPEAVAAFRRHIADHREFPRVDEEHYRILDGNHDGFVTMACIIAIAGLGILGWLADHVLAGVAVAVASWGLAEGFVRVRRLTLTGIVLAFAFFGGVIATFVLALVESHPTWGPKGFAGAGAFIALVSTGTTWLYWKRFDVPFMVSLVALSAVGFVMALAALLLIGPDTYNPAPILYPVALLCGLGVFAFAMRLDLSDPNRVTTRHESAFWVHGVAGTLIAQSLLWVFGTNGPAFYFLSTGQSLTIIVLTIAFAFVALAIDRRALLAAMVAPLLTAFAAMFLHAGLYNSAFGWTALIVGAALLLLSLYWHQARSAIVPMLGTFGRRLPPVAGAIDPETY